MSKHYFRHLPNIRYKNPLSSSNQNDNYVLAKNLFLRTKVRDDAALDITFLQSYTIREGERPEDVSDNLYGSPEYDWIVLSVANIVNVRSEWPMSGKVLYDYALTKYGNDDLNATQFYETTEVKDAQGRLIMPAGKTIDSNFTIPDPDTHNITLNPVIGVSNFLAETRENEKKRNIKVMRPGYLGMYIAETRKALLYTKSSQFEDKYTKVADNPTT